MNILVIPDTQVKTGVPTSHLLALGNYIKHNSIDCIVHLGDHWDMPSLSSYDKGRLASEGTRYQDDIEVGQKALAHIDEACGVSSIRKVFLLGNHENRIRRHVQENPVLKGTLSFKDLGLSKTGWEVHDYLHIVNINGVYFSHYFCNPENAKSGSFTGTADGQLRVLGYSYVQGHRQGLHIASPRYYPDKVTRGIICGSFYQHDEEYRGPQGNDHWRGALLLENVKNGNYRLTELPLNYLLENFF